MTPSNYQQKQKGVYQIKYPREDMILEFISKDHTGHIKLDNKTGN